MHDAILICELFGCYHNMFIVLSASVCMSPSHQGFADIASCLNGLEET